MFDDDDILPFEAQDILHHASDALLRMATTGEIDLNAIAQQELRARLRYQATQDIIAMQRRMMP